MQLLDSNLKPEDYNNVLQSTALQTATTQQEVNEKLKVALKEVICKMSWKESKRS